MARAESLWIAQRTRGPSPRPRARRPRAPFLSRPSATIVVMLLAALATGLCVAGGSGDRDAAVLVAQAPSC
jgi:hypothetical protein